MEQTQERLLEKINALESHVKADMSRGLYDVVRDTATSVGTQLDVRQQIARHPLFVLSASAAMAYWLFGRKGAPTRPVASPANSAENATNSLNPTGDVANLPTRQFISPASGPGINASIWDQLCHMTLNTLAAVIPPLSARIVPPLVERLIDHLGQENSESSMTRSNTTGQPAQSPTTDFADDSTPTAPHSLP